MASIYTTVPGKTIKGFGGVKYPVPFYIQFVPGYTVEVVHSDSSLRYNGANTINSIIALPHMTHKTFKAQRTNTGEEYRYYPLLRGITDVPSKGDPVLLCTIGKTRYYMGPLNTANNSPTWNDDPSYNPEVNLGEDDVLGETSRRLEKGESPNFNKEVDFIRLQKKRKVKLDFGDAVNETTGDTIIEGRHGSSIRVGSRSNSGYIFISNSRNSKNAFESIGDSGIISLTRNGTLAQHFGSYFDPNLDDGSGQKGKLIPEFILSSDNLVADKTNRKMGTLVSSVNGNSDVNEHIYKYDKSQILFNSERITINTRLEDIYISSHNDIHIGSGRHLAITTNENLIIESEKTYLGDPNKKNMQSMVFGEKLLEILEELCGTLGDAQSNMYFPVPLASGGVPLKSKMEQLKLKLKNILSAKHKLEEN